jgi:hypothetical protein
MASTTSIVDQPSETEELKLEELIVDEPNKLEELVVDETVGEMFEIEFDIF